MSVFCNMTLYFLRFFCKYAVSRAEFSVIFLSQLKAKLSFWCSAIWEGWKLKQKDFAVLFRYRISHFWKVCRSLLFVSRFRNLRSNSAIKLTIASLVLAASTRVSKKACFFEFVRFCDLERKLSRNLSLAKHSQSDNNEKERSCDGES